MALLQNVLSRCHLSPPLCVNLSEPTPCPPDRTDRGCKAAGVPAFPVPVGAAGYVCVAAGEVGAPGTILEGADHCRSQHHLFGQGNRGESRYRFSMAFFNAVI